MSAVSMTSAVKWRAACALVGACVAVQWMRPCSRYRFGEASFWAAVAVGGDGGLLLLALRAALPRAFVGDVVGLAHPRCWYQLFDASVAEAVVEPGNGGCRRPALSEFCLVSVSMWRAVRASVGACAAVQWMRPCSRYHLGEAPSLVAVAVGGGGGLLRLAPRAASSRDFVGGSLGFAHPRCRYQLPDASFLEAVAERGNGGCRQPVSCLVRSRSCDHFFEASALEAVVESGNGECHSIAFWTSSLAWLSAALVDVASGFSLTLAGPVPGRPVLLTTLMRTAIVLPARSSA